MKAMEDEGEEEDEVDEEEEEGEEEGAPQVVMAAADVDASAREWIQARRSQLLSLLSGIKAMLRSETAAERSSIVAQLLLLRAFDVVRGAGAPPEPLPSVSGPSTIAELARAWLTMHAPLFFGGLAVERLDAELRAAVARTASDVGAAVAACALLFQLLSAGGDAAGFVAPLRASSIWELVRGVVERER